jgi:hypothetical protein
MDILQPAPGANKMGHLRRAVRITGFVNKWGAHLSTLATGVWMLHIMVIIKVQANKELRLLDNHLVKREGKEDAGKEDEYQDDAHLMDIYSFPGYQVEIEVPTNPDGSSPLVSNWSVPKRPTTPSLTLLRTSTFSEMVPGPISVPKELGAWLIGRGACPILAP